MAVTRQDSGGAGSRVRGSRTRRKQAQGARGTRRKKLSVADEMRGLG